MRGAFFNRDHHTAQEFRAYLGGDRFVADPMIPANNMKIKELEGSWRAKSERLGNDKAKRITDMQGEFTIFEEYKIKASFLAPTGDSRYLEGVLFGEKLYLSSFDWKHVYYYEFDVDFEAKSMKGVLYSGKNTMYHIVADKGVTEGLPDPEKLTYLKPNYESIKFDFPSLNPEKRITFPSEKYDGKSCNTSKLWEVGVLTVWMKLNI